MNQVAVLGATGYVGGRLVPRLLEQGHRVVAISRSMRKLKSRAWSSHPLVTLRAADVTDSHSLTRGLEGCTRAFYLVHSMDPGTVDFARKDRLAAECLVTVAGALHMEHLIYLGGLGARDSRLSQHLQSRVEVSDILQAGPTPTTTLRAAMIIGSGSASFEILRYLVDRLPLMITPRWVNTPSQPIAIRNVLNYLIGCLDCPETKNRCFDIGGEEVLTYLNLMNLYADAAGLSRRIILPVPIFSPKLSAYWISFITPVHSALARPLVAGLKNPAVCDEMEIRSLIPQELLSCREAIGRALRISLDHDIETRWSDAGFLPAEETSFPGDSNWSGGTVYSDRREILVEGSVSALWRHVVRIGGETGWYYGASLWRLRGLMDTVLGGPGDRRGRRDPESVQVGDALDFWRVLAVEPNQRLRLLAEMKVPGQAILEFQICQEAPGVTRLLQTAWFVPRGLLGMLYWWAVTPFHNFVFSGMLRGIARAANLPIQVGPRKTSSSGLPGAQLGTAVASGETC